MIDILIKNGTVIDGTGTPGRKLDVAIENGRISAMGVNIFGKATQIIDATDKFVTPGFIDIQNHSDSYWTILDQPDQLSLLSQGITTIIMGNCGASLAPLLTSESIKTIQKWHSLSGININWASMAEFLAHMATVPKGVNVGTLVGHATLRRGLVADGVRQLTETELKIINKVTQDALAQGAFGLSMGLIYAHEVNSSAAELQQLTNNLKSSGKYLSAHLRSEGSHILEAIDEVVGLATQAQVPLKISHLKIRGQNNWHQFDQVMNKLETAFHQGLNISFDVYPYDTSWTVLYTYLPKWAYEGGRAQILKMISDPASRRKILDYLKASGQEFANIVVAEAGSNESFVGKTIRQIAQNQEVTVEEGVLNIITATNAQVMVFDHNLSNEQIELLCASPLAVIATDGAGFSGRPTRMIHPRCFGAFPRFLSLVREKKILKWEQAVKKITSDPAKLLGLSDRGVLAKNNIADITIFDPMIVTDHADYTHPYLLSDGIEMVLVGGRPSYSNQKVLEVLGLNGKMIKR